MSIPNDRYSTAEPLEHETAARRQSETYVDYEEYEEYEDYEEGGDEDVEEVYFEQAHPARETQSNLPIILATAAGVVLVLVLVSFLMLRNTGSGEVQAADEGQPNAGTTVIVIGPGTTPPPNSRVERPQTGYLAPDFTLAGLDGGTFKLSSYRGQKVVWLNFWATWCPPCRVEMPEMEKVYQGYKDKGVEILGVDVAENPEAVRQFVQEGSYSWPFVLDPESIAFRRYFSTGLPTHVFIKKDGTISSIIIGGLPANMMETELQKSLK